jgi:uracil-DNA glycosylase family 4
MSQTMSDRRLSYLRRMGIDVWQRRADLPAAAVPQVETGDRWDGLAAEVAACARCQLCTTRTQTVFGVGDRSSRLMVVGEAPGADEDRQGEPFVGRAGKLLDQMLRAMGWPRERVYIANILKCRPPNNRDPQLDEVAACEPYLQRQLDLVQPDLILAVGRIAAQNLLKTDLPAGRLRGEVHRYGPHGIPLVVTYHPAYLLRSPKEKARAWEDLKLARDLLARQPVPQDAEA